MSWIPEIPALFSSLERIENEEDQLKDSTDLTRQPMGERLHRIIYWKAIG